MTLFDRLRARDPGNDGLRRAIRAGIFIPVAAAAGYLLGGGTQAPAFAVVGSIALLIVANFPGTLATRALAYCGLGISGAVLITLGTLAAPHPWVAIPLCFVVGVTVSLLGLLSEIVAAGQRATLMAFLLPVCAQPVGPVADRLWGWLIALAVCVPAALFFLPPRYSGELRTLAAEVCALLADRIDGAGSAEQVDPAMAALRKEFLGSAFRPIALTAGSRALIRVVANLQWLSAKVDAHSGPLLGHIAPLSVAVLRTSAQVLRAPDAAGAAELERIVAAHRLIAITHYDNDIRAIFAAPTDADAVELGRTLLSRRTMSATIGLTGRIIATATAADARPAWDRLFGRDLPETGIADRVHTRRSALASIAGYLSTRSVTVLNSLRTGAALALALGVTLVLPVQNSLWVVLGTLSVLRSSAATTRTSAVRVVSGTIAGFLLGAAVIAVVGVDPVVLWTLLPIAAFGSTYVLVVGSFAASQAMFTMMVLIVFNMMRPTGWQIGLIRIEDIVIGAAVGLMVSVLLWPRGAAEAVQRAIDDALATGSRYLAAAVTRVTHGASTANDDRLHDAGRAALVGARTYGDAVRIYLSESGGAIDAGLLDTANRIPRVRIAADLIAEITPPPAGPYAAARAVLDRHTAVLCARLDGSQPDTPTPDLGDEFVLALRAESAAGTVAALPLVTAAANVGELELIYPAGSSTAEAASRA